MRNATTVLPFKMRRPSHRHYFLPVNFRLFSFFTRTTRAEINPGYDWPCHDFVSWLAVAWSCLWIVSRCCVGGLQLLFNTNRKPYPR